MLQITTQLSIIAYKIIPALGRLALLNYPLALQLLK